MGLTSSISLPYARLARPSVFSQSHPFSTPPSRSHVWEDEDQCDHSELLHACDMTYLRDTIQARCTLADASFSSPRFCRSLFLAPCPYLASTYRSLLNNALR